MNKRFRCESRDQFGHRCTKRLNHRRKVKGDPHRAFGHEWPSPEAMRQAAKGKVVSPHA